MMDSGKVVKPDIKGSGCGAGVTSKPASIIQSSWADKPKVIKTNKKI